MISRCTLDIGGLISADHAGNMISVIRLAGATYLLLGNTLISAGSTSTDQVLQRIKGQTFSFIFQDNRGHEMPKHLKQCLEEFGLDYRWAWEGYDRIDPGMICVDATLRQEAQFPAIANRIVLEVADLEDTVRIDAAKHWSTWNPRPLMVYASKHELLQAHAGLR